MVLSSPSLASLTLLESAFAVPMTVTFEQAITLTQSLLDQLVANDLADAELEVAVSQLVQHENGARGFFVSYLTDPRPVADTPSPGLIQALRSSPEQVAELLVKNLAMATAMAVTHRRNQNEDMAQGSERVQQRLLGLIQQVQLPQVQTKVAQMQASLTTANGPYQTFLERWEYDVEQRQAIAQVLSQLPESP